YIARIGEHVTIVNPVLEPPGGPVFVPDVAVVRGTADDARAEVATAVAGPPAVALTNIEFVDPHTETYVEVRRLPDHELVTVLELLSPTNKYGDGRGDYMRKRRDFRRQSVNVVELDLLRAGARFEFVEPLPPGQYYAFVSRASRPSITYAHAWSVRSRLPTVPIPRRPPDGE